MSYTTKSAILYSSSIAISFLIAAIVAVGLFIFFGAYMPDGFSITGYVYGITDPEGIITIVATVLTMVLGMSALVSIGERHI